MVNNGKEALDKVKSAEFDLVLMDIHMPEMDGITATKKIRKLGERDKASLPIIALTANALKTDHLHYIEAGIDDCVTKPYTEDKLFRVISKVLGHGEGEETKADATAEVEAGFIEQRSLLYDLSFINEFAKGDTSFIKKMINAFLESMVTELRQMIISEQARRYSELSRSAHKMKSAIDGLGIEALKIPIRDIEALKATQEDHERVKALVEKVKRTLEDVFVQLEGFLKL